VAETLPVLFVDDNEDLRAGYAELLRVNGFKVATAESGAAALQVVQQFHPDVIVLDLCMPGLDGFDTARALKHSAITRDIPILAFTSLGYSDKKAEAAGCERVLRKTGPVDRFVDTVRKMATLHRTHAVSAEEG
jgi:two-component system, NtrC family, sensor kinase